MKELDILLSRWLDQHYEALGAAEMTAFRQLLSLPDPELARYLLAGDRADDAALAHVIDSIRGGTPD